MIRYLTLAEYLWLAEQVTGVGAAVLAKASRLDLADSALHVPQAGFGDEEFYPDIFDKAAVSVCRPAWKSSSDRRQQACGVGGAGHVGGSQPGQLGSRSFRC